MDACAVGDLGVTMGECEVTFHGVKVALGVLGFLRGIIWAWGLKMAGRMCWVDACAVGDLGVSMGESKACRLLGAQCRAPLGDSSTSPPPPPP